MPTGSHDPRLPGNVVGLPGVDIETIVDQLRAAAPAAPAAAQPTASDDDPYGWHPSYGLRRRPPRLLAPGEPSVFTVRVDLEHADPPIWRRIEVDGSLTLGRLHHVLQAAMGWNDQHLHHFLVGPGERDYEVQPFATDYESDDGPSVGEPHERDVRLEQVVAAPGDRLYYEYDFGDGWEHTLEVEAVRPLRDGDPLVRCTGGERACPPEDVGGIPGYAEVLDALEHGTENPWLREKLAWLPDGFDPDAFDLAAVDAETVATVEASAELALLDPEVVATFERLDGAGRARVEPWCRAASRASLDVDASLAAQLMAPWQALLETVGDGLRLTAAGYLPPATVSSLARGLRTGYAADIMFGKANREEHVRPVAALRRTATAMGLLRKVKGALHLTKAGQACLGDPVTLMRHLASRLPVGAAPHELDAGRLVLLAAAAGDSASYEEIARLLAAAGWLVDDLPPPRWVAIDWARDTYDVLSLAGWNVKDAGILRHDPRASVLAVLAVRG